MKAKEIARIADCKPDYVRKVLNDQVAKRPKPVKANLRKPAPPGPPVPEAGHGAQAEPGAASNPKWFERAVADSLPGLDPLLERLRRGEESPELRTALLDPSRVRVITHRELKQNTNPHDLNLTDEEEQARMREWLWFHFSDAKRSTQ